MEKKVIKTFSEIKKDLDSKKDGEKKDFLKSFLKDEDYTSIKKDLVKELLPLITKKSIISYNLIYDSLSEGLEPIYFWILDFMRDSSPSGLKLDVWKGSEEFEASVTSGYFGEIGQRATLMQQKAMEYLGTINNIIKSILNLIYDLKEFEIRLEPYNKFHDKKINENERLSALHSLKGVWMDQVDARKGRGSINLLVQDLQFVTLRDAFFYVKDSKEIDKLDLNLRVKNILLRKIEEFNSWLIFSEKEIRQRYDVEKTYLKSQAGTLKLYANWLKPYLIAAQKLKMRDTSTKSLTNPNIVNSFSNMEIELKLYGKKEISPADVHESFKNAKLDEKYFSVVEVVMIFRSVPSSLSGQGGRQYVHSGRTDINFNSYVMDNVELDVLESHEMYEDLELIDSYVGSSLARLQEEIDKYTKEPEKEEKKKKEISSIENPFKGLFSGFKEIYSPIKEIVASKSKDHGIVHAEIDKFAREKSKDIIFKIYNTYKDVHGMLAL